MSELRKIGKYNEDFFFVKFDFMIRRLNIDKIYYKKRWKIWLNWEFPLKNSEYEEEKKDSQRISNKNILCPFQTLSHCELITDDGIRQLAAGSCAAESLSVLELDNCPLITDQTLEHLVSCHNLQRIELYDCQMITRAAIRRLRVHTILYSKPFLTIFLCSS